MLCHKRAESSGFTTVLSCFQLRSSSSIWPFTSFKIDLTNINQIFLNWLRQCNRHVYDTLLSYRILFCSRGSFCLLRDKHFTVFPPRSTAHSSTIPIFFKFYIFLPFRACSSLVKSVFCLPLLTILNVLPSLSFYSKDEKKTYSFLLFLLLSHPNPFNFKST